jgi:hypothetical protein
VLAINFLCAVMICTYEPAKEERGAECWSAS